MCYVVLLVDAREEMRVRADGKDAHVIAGVGGLVERDRSRVREVGISEVHVEGVLPTALVEVLVEAHAGGVAQSEVQHVVFA